MDCSNDDVLRQALVPLDKWGMKTFLPGSGNTGFKQTAPQKQSTVKRDTLFLFWASVYPPDPVLAEHRSQRGPVLPVGKHRTGIIDMGHRAAQPSGYVTVRVDISRSPGASIGYCSRLRSALQDAMQVVHGMASFPSG